MRHFTEARAPALAARSRGVILNLKQYILGNMVSMYYTAVNK